MPNHHSKMPERRRGSKDSYLATFTTIGISPKNAEMVRGVSFYMYLSIRTKRFHWRSDKM